MIDTSGAFVSGYTVAGLILAAYVATLVVRSARTRARLRAMSSARPTRAG
jgi:hypothetical protein